MAMMLMLLFTFVLASPRYRHDVCCIIRAVLLEVLARSELHDQGRQEYKQANTLGCQAARLDSTLLSGN